MTIVCNKATATAPVVVTARQRSYGEVMFSVVYVSVSLFAGVAEGSNVTTADVFKPVYLGSTSRCKPHTPPNGTPGCPSFYRDIPAPAFPTPDNFNLLTWTSSYRKPLRHVQTCSFRPHHHTGTPHSLLPTIESFG